jgi:hypothetical protein
VKKKLFIFLLLTTYGLVSFGQHEMTLFNMNNVFQSTYVNPSSVPENKVSIGLPGISSVRAGVYFSPFVAKDVTVVKTNDSTYGINLDKAIAKMAKNNNYLNTHTSVDLFSLRFKVRNVYVSLNATNITDVRFNFPRDLFSLAWYGNAQYVGSSANLKNVALDATQYNEYAVGFTRAKDGGKFTYGVRLKFLQGLNNFHTASSNGSIAVDNQFYTNTISANMHANSASVIPYDTRNINYTKAATNFQNVGYGIDLGLSYSPTKKWTFTGAVNNLGAITWKTNAKSHSVDGTYQFTGVSLDSVSKGGVSLDTYGKSLSSSMHYKESPVTKYRTALTSSVYLSASYSLGRNTKLALTGYGEFYYGFKPAGSVALIQRAGRVLNLVFSYNARQNSYNNMGIGLMIKPGPFQIYVVGDNMLILNPFNSNNFTVRTGMNLVFGKTRKPEMQSHKEL